MYCLFGPFMVPPENAQFGKHCTRIITSTSAFLDLITTSTPRWIVCHSVAPQTIAHHDLISLKFNVQVTKPEHLNVTKTDRWLIAV